MPPLNTHQGPSVKRTLDSLPNYVDWDVKLKLPAAGRPP